MGTGTPVTAGADLQMNCENENISDFKLQKTQFFNKNHILSLILYTKIAARFQAKKSAKGGGKRQAPSPEVET